MSLLAQDERLTRRVGAVTLLVLGAAILFMLVVYDRIEWGPRVRVEVYFRTTGGLREGAALMVAGRQVGSIETVARSPHGADTPLGGEEGIVVTLAISAREAGRIPRGGDLFVASRSFLSERYLEMGPSTDATAGPYRGGERVRGVDPPTIDRVLNRTWRNLQTAREFAQVLRPEFERLRTEVRALAGTLEGLVPDAVGVFSLAAEVRGLSDELDRLRAALGGDAASAKLDGVIAQARSTAAQAALVFESLRLRAHTLAEAADALGDRIGLRGRIALRTVELAIDRMRAAAAKVEPMLAVVAQITDRLERGEGSLGRLMKDPEFPEDAKELGKIMKREPWKIFGRPAD
ncbi:MAG: MCE family protein [Deltaproteobacteria bacterium]|nr:MCE family protein [Deltaproteobacteria bacterium]